MLKHVFRSELDACDSPDKYPQLFQVLLEIEVENTEKQKDLTPPWEQFPTKDLSPNILFSCHQEHKDALAVAGGIWSQNWNYMAIIYCTIIKIFLHLQAYVSLWNSTESVK